MFIYFRTSVCIDEMVAIGKVVSLRVNPLFGKVSPWLWPIAGIELSACMMCIILMCKEPACTKRSVLEPSVIQIVWTQ